MEKTAKKIADEFNGKIWTKKDADNNIKICRVYIGKGFAQINQDGVNIDAVPRANFQQLRDWCIDNNINHYRR